MSPGCCWGWRCRSPWCPFRADPALWGRSCPCSSTTTYLRSLSCVPAEPSLMSCWCGSVFIAGSDKGWLGIQTVNIISWWMHYSALRLFLEHNSITTGPQLQSVRSHSNIVLGNAIKLKFPPSKENSLRSYDFHLFMNDLISH